MTTVGEARVIRWLDSAIQNGQVDKDDLPKPLIVTSVGFVVAETDEYVTIARDHMHDEEEFRGLLSIPKIAVAP